MKKVKRIVFEFSPDRDGMLATMDEFTRQMNGLARGFANKHKHKDAHDRARAGAEAPSRPRQKN
jgi:hypothetical protein